MTILIIQCNTPWGFPGGSVEKNPPSNQVAQAQSLGFEDPLEKEMATHSNNLAWEIPRTEEPVNYSPRGHKELDTPEHAFT